MARAVAGDAAARHDLFVRYRDDAFRAAFRITGQHADALDVVQDSFIKAFESLAGFQGDSSFKTWFLRIVANRALDVLRKRRVRLVVSLDGDEDSAGLRGYASAGLAASDEAPAGRELENREMGVRLQDAIGKLPPEHRAVLSMYAAGEHTYAQIAEALGIPIGTVMSRLYNARRKLRELLPDLARQFAGPATQETES